MSVWVKICGVTSLRDAELVMDAGADALGLNFVPGSPRCIGLEQARVIARACRGRVELVGVVANLALEACRRLRDELGLSALQLHGDEPTVALEALLPAAYKALRVGDAADLAAADAFGGDRLLVDARVEGALGGTGRCVDADLVRPLARRRRVILAGGLRPENVAARIAAVEPWGVDVASGVEQEPGVKSEPAVRAFVRQAREARAGREI